MKEKKEGLGEEVGHGDNFPGLAKMCLILEKIEMVTREKLNSNSFEFNSNGLNKD